MNHLSFMLVSLANHFALPFLGFRWRQEVLRCKLPLTIILYARNRVVDIVSSGKRTRRPGEVPLRQPLQRNDARVRPTGHFHCRWL